MLAIEANICVMLIGTLSGGTKYEFEDTLVVTVNKRLKML
jgi:ketopantoate hydroxymethyltransferase